MGSSSLVIALALAAGCGPIAYVNQTTREASTKVDRAKSLDAEKLSPYWYTRAITYLRMSREVAAHADFQGANRFGRLAADAANAAEKQAGARPGVDDKRQIAPAKDTAPIAPAKDAR